MNEELLAAVREAIAGTVAPDYILTMEATAAVEAMLAIGYVQAAGWEYALKRGDALMAQSFNTREQAEEWLKDWPSGEFELVRRPVGVWEPVT